MSKATELTANQKAALSHLRSGRKITVEGWAAKRQTTPRAASGTLSSLVRRGVARRIVFNGQTYYIHAR